MPQLSEDRVLKAMGELGAAITQSLPTDDQVIMDHVRKAHELLQEEWRERRDAAMHPRCEQCGSRNLTTQTRNDGFSSKPVVCNECGHEQEEPDAAR